MLPSIALWYTFKQYFNCLSYEIRWQPNIYQWETDSIKFSHSLDSVGLTYFCTKCSVCRLQWFICLHWVWASSPSFLGRNFSSNPLQGLVWHPPVQQMGSCPLQRGRANNSDLLCLISGPKWSSPRLCTTPARRGRVNLATPPTISFSLHIHYSSQLGMSHSSGPYAVPYALNYISIALKIHGSLNLPGK